MPMPARFHPANRPAPLPYRPILSTHYNQDPIYRNFAPSSHQSNYQPRYYSYKPDLDQPASINNKNEKLETPSDKVEDLEPPTDAEVIDVNDEVSTIQTVQEAEILEVVRANRPITRPEGDKGK